MLQATIFPINTASNGTRPNPSLSEGKNSISIFENISILDLGKKIQNKIDCEIDIIDSNDPRSYRQCSDKLIETGFEQKFNVNNAIDEISDAFYNKNLPDYHHLI